MINAYKSMGHGCIYISPVTLTFFTLAAILYVDDTDLLMRARGPRTPDRKFCEEIQRAINAWAEIVIATGGSIKTKKSYVSINSYRFREGKAILKRRRCMPRKFFTVPQPSGQTDKIEVIETSEAKKTLGVFTCTAGSAKVHVKEMAKKGTK